MAPAERASLRECATPVLPVLPVCSVPKCPKATSSPPIRPGFDSASPVELRRTRVALCRQSAHTSAAKQPTDRVREIDLKAPCMGALSLCWQRESERHVRSLLQLETGARTSLRRALAE